MKGINMNVTTIDVLGHSAFIEFEKAGSLSRRAQLSFGEDVSAPIANILFRC